MPDGQRPLSLYLPHLVHALGGAWADGLKNLARGDSRGGSTPPPAQTSRSVSHDLTSFNLPFEGGLIFHTAAFGCWPAKWSASFPYDLTVQTCNILLPFQRNSNMSDRSNLPAMIVHQDSLVLE